MTGLDNPRGLVWGPESALYLAESGRGGPQPCDAGPGAIVATDAGGNDLLRGGANGWFSRVAVFPSSSNSARGIDSVPTAVARGPDGAYYVGELASFAPGQANVWRVVPGQAPTVYKSGLHDDHRHHVRLGWEPLRPRVRPGSTLACAAHGARSVVASGLVTPDR